MARIGAYFEKLSNYRFLVQQLVMKNIKLKYRKSYLGVIWSMIEPILTMLVLALVFGSLLGRGDQYFPIYILCGRLLYSFFSSGTKVAMKSIRSNSAMMKKVYIPKWLYPLSNCLSSYVISLISLVDLFLVVLIMRMEITPYILLSVIPMGILFLLTYGVAMILTTINVFFRDIEYIWEVFLMLIMYTCAIFYKPESFIGTAAYTVFRWNPLFALIQSFRDCVFGQPMDWGLLLYAFGFSVATIVVGVWLFTKQQNKFILHI